MSSANFLGEGRTPEISPKMAKKGPIGVKRGYFRVETRYGGGVRPLPPRTPPLVAHDISNFLFPESGVFIKDFRLSGRYVNKDAIKSDFYPSLTIFFDLVETLKKSFFW